MKPWDSLSLSAEIIDASWVLHSSVCLVTWSKMLFIALTLAWSKSFSVFLIICLALGGVKVDLSLMLAGTKLFMDTSKGEDSVIFYNLKS